MDSAPRPPAYFMVRAASKQRDDSEYFLKHGVVAVDWSAVDLRQTPRDEVIHAALQAHDAGKAPNIVAKKRGELRRFLEIGSGDRIVVPMGKVAALCEAMAERAYIPTAVGLANQIRARYVMEADQARLVDRSTLSEGLQRKLRGKGCTVLSLDEYSAELERLFDPQPIMSRRGLSSQPPR